MAEFAEEISGLPFEIETATVSLVHYTYDEHLTEPVVWQMVEKLAKRKLKSRLKNFVEDATIYFTGKGKAREDRIYPKMQEVLKNKNTTEEAIRYANGNLRFESSFNKKTAIDSLLKRYSLPNSLAHTILTEDISDLVIADLLKSLNFFELLTDDKTELQLLLEHFPAKKAMVLRGFVQMIKEYGENFFKNKSLGISKDVYYRRMRECREAKIW